MTRMSFVTVFLYDDRKNICLCVNLTILTFFKLQVKHNMQHFASQYKIYLYSVRNDQQVSHFYLFLS